MNLADQKLSGIGVAIGGGIGTAIGSIILVTSPTLYLSMMFCSFVGVAAGAAIGLGIAKGRITFIQTCRFFTLMLTSFSLSLSMAHLLELPQRMQFDQQLWVKVTVFENVYKLFGSVGAVFEITAILTAIVLIFLVRRRGSTFYWTLGGAIFLVIALVSWIVFIAPMNAEFAKWSTNPIPLDWTRYRDQWEYSHAVNAIIKIIGLSLLTISVVVETPKKLILEAENAVLILIILWRIMLYENQQNLTP
jgi:hypothetical protein